MPHAIDIHMLPASAHVNTNDMARIADIVNRSFAAAERGIWKEGATRTTVADVTASTERGEMVVACLQEDIVGCLCLGQIDAETGGFGMLAVDVMHQNKGIARALVRFAEQICQSWQYRKMQLELLTPQDTSHSSKTFLESWYKRIGYHRVHTESFALSFPDLAQLLAVPCELVVFQKNLSAS